MSEVEIREDKGGQQIWIEDQFYGWVATGYNFWWPIYHDGTTLKAQKTKNGAVRALVNHNLMQQGEE